MKRVLAGLVYRAAYRVTRGFMERLVEGAGPGAPRAVEESLRRGARVDTLYIHIPFCRMPCSFCCFVRMPYREDLYWRYLRALERELEAYASLIEGGVSIYIGGGTPTINHDGILELLDHVRSLFQPRDVSVEANPFTVTPELVRQLASLGVTRLSIGVQSLDENILRLIGRRNHTPGQAIEAVKTAAGVIPVVNVDLIWGVREIPVEGVLRDAERLASLGANQATFYPITSGLKGLPLTPMKPGEEYRAYSEIYRVMRGLGFTPSTAWHYSRLSGAMVDEYIVESYNYAGAGLSSIGRIGGLSYANTFNIERYIEAASKGRLTAAMKTAMTPREQALYELAMQAFGLKIRTTPPGTPGYAKLLLRILFRRTDGLMTIRDLEAQYLVNVVMRAFIAGVTWFRRTVLRRRI